MKDVQTSRETSVQTSRETLDVDVLIIGCGSSALSCAIHLKKLSKKFNINPSVSMIEKSQEIGAHSVSGAILNPIALNELLPDYKNLNPPTFVPVSDEKFYFLSKKSAFRLPTPPSLKNKGFFIISVSKFNRWLGQIASDLEVDIFTGFSATDAIFKERKVEIHTGDMGLDKHQNPKPNFQRGYSINAKIVVFAEGPRGSLFQKVSKKLNLRAGKPPDTYSLGVKEIIKVNDRRFVPGAVIHTMGFPLKKSVGGTFIYAISETEIIVGLVGYLNTLDPQFDVQLSLQQLKTHPKIYSLIKGGEVISYASRCIPSGGYYSMPKLYHDSMLVIGDSASMVDDRKLKGIHLGMKSGMLAAETIVDHFTKSEPLKTYEQKVYSSYIRSDLKKSKDFHQLLDPSLFVSAKNLIFKKTNKNEIKEDYSTTLPLSKIKNYQKEELPLPDGKLFLDKLGGVYLTKTIHDENSPNHLQIHDNKVCSQKCVDTYNSPCTFFCPASVYEMVDKNLQINFTNCIHCKACDIKCPFDNITWNTPEGGTGPGYTDT